MKKKPRHIGDEHVKSVYLALLQSLNKVPIDQFPETVIKTVHYIINLYPNVETVSSKFDRGKSDQEKDITLHLNNNDKVHVNLFHLKKAGRIQPKNPGAKSFFLKYFLSEQLQKMFNQEFESKYVEYLTEVLTSKIGTHYVTDKRELKKSVSKYFPKFTKNINLYRDHFLYSLREASFTLMKDFYNNKDEGFFYAYNVFFMTEDINIITYYGRNENDISVVEFNPGIPNFSDIQLYKAGKNTVGIKYGKVALTLRFKFESSPISSIKLAASYDTFPDELEKELLNSRTVQKMGDLLSNHIYMQTSNSSNAIGKCHEAISYYYFLKEYPEILQVEHNECVKLFNKYYSLVEPVVLEKLHNSTSTLVPVIRESLNEKYNTYTMESIELVPDSYISDRLDTGDLQLVLKVNNNYVVESISLKALAKKNSKITTKNPGIGTILGPTYFKIGSIDHVVSEVKSKFEIGELNHKESLEVLALELGLNLKEATQGQLKQGIENLFGKAMIAVTFYDESISYCKEHSKIDSTIRVYVKTPSAIQNTLAWNNDLETISLRVKFSRGQKYGWSSIKLTSEYQLK